MTATKIRALVAVAALVLGSLAAGSMYTSSTTSSQSGSAVPPNVLYMPGFFRGR